MNRFVDIRKELRYAFHVIFHPFDGFWDIKHEKRGSLRASLILVFLMIFVFCAEQQFTGYYFSSSQTKSLLIQFTSVLLPLFIWSLSNWCITTLLDGKGTFLDIVTATGYAMTPVILLHIPMLILSNILTADNAAFYSILSFVASAWALLLVFVAMMTIHQFTAAKTLAACFIAVLGMAIMVFLVIVFLTIIQQVYDMFYTIWREWMLRF